MRTIINYIRSCFCKHDFELIFSASYIEDANSIPTKHVKVYRCTKCGYSKKYEV